MYLLRLDDASEYMNDVNWLRMERLLDQYSVKPLVGVIPDNQDDKLMIFGEVSDFWNRVKRWTDKGWAIALHGHHHVYETADGGINPVQKRSEFAGLPLEQQKEKIREGNELLLQHGIKAKVFYAPSHTFDLYTLQALKEETHIRVISDTIASDVYYENEFYFLPQQSGAVRKLPFKLSTFCYHPNTMKDVDFKKLEAFLKVYGDQFTYYSDNLLKKRKKSYIDKLFNRLYFLRK